jgi:PhnB protein
MSDVKPIPDGFTAITPYLVVNGASDAIAFYTKAFGAQELYRMLGPDGKILHAELQIGGARLLLSDENPAQGAVSPKGLKGSPASLLHYVADADAALARAIGAGATELMPPADMFWGDRFGIVEDPFGHRWQIATHKEDVSPADLKERMAAALQNG